MAGETKDDKSGIKIRTNILTYFNKRRNVTAGGTW